MVGVAATPSATMRPVVTTSATAIPEGTTKKSALLVPVPAAVSKEILPLWAELGTVAIARPGAVKEVTTPPTPPKNALLLLTPAWKFVPLMVTAVPAVPIVGVKLVMVGADKVEPTVN